MRSHQDYGLVAVRSHPISPTNTCIVVDVTSEFREVPGVRSREYYCLQALDGSTPDFDELSALATSLAQREEPMFIHCAAGHSRSCLLVACILLVRAENHTIENVVPAISAVRRWARLTEQQHEMLKRFANEHGTNDELLV